MTASIHALAFVALLGQLVSAPSVHHEVLPNTPPSVEITIETASPDAAEPVTFVFRVRDPDPLTVAHELVIDYGDGTGTTISRGPRLLCGEVLTATGLDTTVRTHHPYGTPGTYTVRAQATVGRSVCDVPLGPPEQASTRTPIVVR